MTLFTTFVVIMLLLLWLDARKESSYWKRQCLEYRKEYDRVVDEKCTISERRLPRQV